MKDEDFRLLCDSIKEAGRIRRGRAKPSRAVRVRAVDVRAIRRKLGRSQTEFAFLIGVSVATLRNWEQGRRSPVGPAQTLLRVFASDPQAVVRALAASARP